MEGTTQTPGDGDKSIEAEVIPPVAQDPPGINPYTKKPIKPKKVKWFMRPKPEKPPGKNATDKKGLTVKQAKLIKGMVDGLSAGRAGLLAGYGKNIASASVTACKTLKSANVRQRLQEALERRGLTIDAIADQIARGIRDGKLGQHDGYLKLAMRAHGLEGEDKLDTPEGAESFMLEIRAEAVRRGIKEP